jgi:hypothetical protein
VLQSSQIDAGSALVDRTSPECHIEPVLVAVLQFFEQHRNLVPGRRPRLYPRVMTQDLVLVVGCNTIDSTPDRQVDCIAGPPVGCRIHRRHFDHRTVIVGIGSSELTPGMLFVSAYLI